MPSPPRSDPRYEMLDAWRGLACLMVVLHHSGFALSWDETSGDPARMAVVSFLRLMDQGVPLFFVISGYCIAASLDGHRRRGASSWTFLGVGSSGSTRLTGRRFWCSSRRPGRSTSLA